MKINGKKLYGGIGSIVFIGIITILLFPNISLKKYSDAKYGFSFQYPRFLLSTTNVENLSESHYTQFTLQEYMHLGEGMPIVDIRIVKNEEMFVDPGIAKSDLSLREFIESNESYQSPFVLNEESVNGRQQIVVSEENQPGRKSTYALTENSDYVLQIGYLPGTNLSDGFHFDSPELIEAFETMRRSMRVF